MQFIFANIYNLFSGFYGVNLNSFLLGYVGEGNYGMVLYNHIGLYTLFISLAVALVYYYVVNSPSFNRPLHWAAVLGLNAVLCFLVGYFWVSSQEASLPKELLYNVSDSGEVLSQVIGSSNYLGFALANAIVSVVFFFLLSMAVKWKSVNCKNTPF